MRESEVFILKSRSWSRSRSRLFQKRGVGVGVGVVYIGSAKSESESESLFLKLGCRSRSRSRGKKSSTPQPWSKVYIPFIHRYRKPATFSNYAFQVAIKSSNFLVKRFYRGSKVNGAIIIKIMLPNAESDCLYLNCYCFYSKPFWK